MQVEDFAVCYVLYPSSIPIGIFGKFLVDSVFEPFMASQFAVQSERGAGEI